MENKNSISRILLSAILCACYIINAPQANAYDSLIQAIGDTVSPRTYELTSNETTSAALGTMGGADDAVFTVDGGANNYGIINTTSNKDARLYITKQAQTFNLQNVGSYTTTTSDSIIAGKSVITDVVVGNAVKDFGIIDPASANNSSYTGFLRSAGKSNVTNSVFYNIKGLYGAAIQNRENGTLSVKNSVIVGNTSMQGAIHNDSTQKIADISDSVFYNNTAAFVTGSGNTNISSAIHNKSGKTIDLITRSTFTNNTATGDSKNIAATIYNGGTIGTISDSIFYNNTSVSNGAIMYNDSTGTITTLSGSYFVNNTAVGGILETKGSISNVINSTFTGNTVEKNGIISLHNDTAASSISIGEINNVQVTDNTGNGIYIRTGKSDSTLNIGKITGGTKFNNNTEDGLYMGGNSGIINVTEISNSEFSNNTKTGFYIQNINSGSGQITISKITDNTKINGNLEGGIFLQRNGSNTLGIGEISDTEIKNNTITTLTKRGAGLRNEGAHITKMSGVVFENDNLDYTTNGTLGGAIYNSAYGQIDEMTDITISNCSAFNGGAMYNLGTIGSIDGMMVSNIDTSDVMIATEENAHIETINDMTIQNSAGTGLSFYGGTGGTIQNSTFTNMYGAGAKMGYGLQVTAKPQEIGGFDGHVDLIDNITVAGNQTGGMRIDDNKSTTHTANVGLIKNSQFTNNGTSGNDKAGGIWAKTDILTISADGVGKTTTFKDNKRQNQAVGIWMENKNSTLNLQQLNSGEMFMYDPINGTSDRYYVNISGDNTGTIHLYDDIVNGMVDVKTTNVSTIDGKIHDYSFSTLSSDTDSKYTLDIFFDKTSETSSTIDTFTISNANLTPETGVLRETAGTITLHALNFLNDVDSSMIGKSAILQIIKAPSGNSLGLVNGFERDPEFGYVLFTLQNDVKTEYDEIEENTDWDTQIKVYDVTTKVVGDVEILTTSTTDDTLKITIAESTQNKQFNGNYLDTLMAVNQAELDTRNFTTDASNAIYNVTDNLGVTAAGNFNIKGKDSEHSLIDFNETEHYKGFELNNATNLTLENVEIKNSYQLVSGVATDANINIFNSYLHDNGKGIYTAGNVNIEGTTQIDDDLYLMGDTSELTVTGQIRGVATPADITFNKKLAGSETSTFTFSSGTVILGSSASVDDTNLVLNNSVLNVGANNAFSNVNLTAAGADLNLKNESIGEQTFNNLTLNDDINIGIDVDLNNKTTDKIIVSGTDADNVAANGNNIIIGSIYILTAGEDTTTNVVLTEDSRFSGIYKLSDDILDNIDKAAGVSGSYTVSYRDFDPSFDANKGILVFSNDTFDTLAATIVKNLGDEAIKAYLLPETGETAEQNLGSLIGARLTVTGNGITGKNFVKGGDTYTGVTLGDGKTQTLVLKNIDEWSGFADSAIINKSNGTVQIENVNFSGNNATDKGGAIYNKGTIADLAGTYTGNTAASNGGAIYNEGTITISSATFTGNTQGTGANQTPNSIYNKGTINIANSKTVTVNDGWKSDNAGLLTMGSGSTLYLNIANNVLQDDSLGTLTKNGTINTSFDVNLNQAKADTLSTTAVTLSDGSGVVTIDHFNLIGTATNFDKDTKIQILKTQENALKLALSETAAAQLGALEFQIGTTEASETPEAITATTAWDKVYQKTVVSEGVTYGTLTLATTDTENDSLGVVETRNTSTTTYEDMGDTLMLVNQDTTNSVKDFTAPSDGALYEVTDNLGATKGTVNINGVADGNAETLELKGFTGFEVGNGAVALNFNDVTIGDSTLTPATTTIANVANTDATIGLNDVILNGKITGSGYEVTTSGNTTLNSTVGGNITNSGILNSSLSNTLGTVTNNGTFNLSGDLTKDIAGSGSTVLQSDTVSVTDGVNITGTLNVNNKTIGLNNNNYDTLNVGKLASNGNLTLDVNANTDSADQIHINSNGSNSVLTITILNLTAPTDTAEDVDSYTYSKQILTGSTTGASIVLGSGAVASKYNIVNKDILRTGTNELDTYAIAWDDNYGGWKESGLQNNKVEIVENDTIKYSINKTWSGNREYTTKAENLAIMNSYTGQGANNRSVDFNGIFNASENGTYTVSADLGNSSEGTYTLKGVKNGDNNTTIDLNGHSGFSLNNDTELVFQNIDFKGNDTLITVNNQDASISLNNSNIQGAINRTNNAEYDINSEGNSSLMNVTGAKVANEGNLSFSGTNNLVNITNNTGNTNVTSGTTTSGEITQNTVTITGGKLVATNGITTNNGISNGADNGLEVQNGAINSNISGAGSTKINGDVSLTDGKNITQIVNLNTGTFTANATGIQGGVDVSSGTLKLTGGTLNSNVTGEGSTQINAGSNTVSVGTGTIANDVTVSSGTLESTIAKLEGNITNNATFNVSGDLTKDIAGSGSTVLQSDTVSVTDGVNITGTLNVNNKTIDLNNNSYETLNVGKLASNGNLTLDVNANTDSADQIHINSNGSNSVLTITTLNLTAPTDTVDNYTYTKQILTGTTTGVSLALSDALIPPVETQISRTGADGVTNTISWDDTYGGWTQNGTQTEILSIVSSDSIKYDLNKVWDPKSYTSKVDNLAAINQYSGAGSDDKNFNFDTENDVFNVTKDTGIAKPGKLTVNGKTDGETNSTINFNSHKGFELNNDDTELVLKNVEIKDSSALVSGNASNGVKVVLDNVNIHDNGTGIKTAGDIEIKGKSDISDNIEVTGANSKIDIDATDGINLNSNFAGSGTSALNISNGTVNLGENAGISALDTTLNNTSLNIADENSLNGLNTTFNGINNLNISNNKVGTLALGNVNLNGVLRMQVDADLTNSQMDKLTATSATIGNGGKIEVSKINLLSPTTQKQLDLLFTNNSNLAGVVNYTGEGQIAYSPIYKYNTSYIRGADGSGHFRFETQGNGYGDFNPSVMASSVTAIVSGYQNQMQALHNGFYHMDRYMKHSHLYRFAAENQNKYALLEPATNIDINAVPETSQAMWTLPYSSFERVSLRGGVKVDNISYGMTYGGDSNMFDMAHGFKGLISAFVGYNGNQMSYNGISMSQNGGFLGATLNAYKGNFFTGITLSTGASTGDANTMYGREDITLLTAGIANKTGYNFEFWDGKVIFQPSLFLGYSWVNTFDYTNSAGVRIKQDALNALQIAPGIKVIGNTKSGWQPYAGVDMVWNIFMGRNQVRANDVVLPQLSERAYVQYGAGIQKTWADRFTGFLQAMVRNGGRNGVVLSAGFRWTLGKDNKNSKNTDTKQKTVIKQLK